MPQPRSDRRDQILQALAAMLEAGPESKITTARLAQQVGVLRGGPLPPLRLQDKNV